MLSHVLEATEEVGFDETYLVVGHRADLLKKHYRDRKVSFVHQRERLGTAHAVAQVKPHLEGREASVVVLAGDMPLISGKTLKGLIDFHLREKAAATILVAKLDNPFGYGRIIRGDKGEVVRIVEEKDATEEEKKVSEINAGIYCFDNKKLLGVLDKVGSDNAQHEFYLTDTIKLLKENNLLVSSFTAADPKEAIGVNTREQLEELEKIL
jgi:bifunctional UDP-N-acetylglucosamine pyrophosphorylase/glucosamine-1-phosphate N-acetyltransferase